MNRATQLSVRIGCGQDKPALSREQKTFNSLIKQIEKRRERLAAWEAVIPAFQQQYANDYVPLERATTALQIRMVHTLDQAHEHMDLTKTERRKVAAVILDLADEVFNESESVKAIYRKYSPTSTDSTTAMEADRMQTMLKAMFGVELGHDGSPEERLQRAQAHIERQAAQASAEAAEREARRAARKKTPKQLAAEARAQEEQAQTNLSIREVYRRLASALHPDREPDPQERDRKTKLMQRVNEAYNKEDLSQLLVLQLELAYIDQQAINNLGEERLKQYNKILRQQVRGLDDEILCTEFGFRQTYSYNPGAELSPDVVLPNLVTDIRNLEQSLRSLEQDLAACSDLKSLKRRLKDVKLVAAPIGFDDVPWPDPRW